MADDNMEIFDYYGHGDDDIDINIDIESENQDEDFIIEDARSEAGTNNDDEMVDDDNGSYNMEDADFVPEHDLPDVNNETIEISEVEMLRSDGTDTHNLPSEVISDPALQGGEGWTLDNSVDYSKSSTETVKTEEPHFKEPSNTLAEVVPQLTPSPEADVNNQKPSLSPSNNQTNQEEKINTHSPPHIPEESKQDEASFEAIDASKQGVPSELDLISEDRHVIVVYQSSEYALVSSSEFEDPDSYFLKDPSVMKEPLPVLFAALRDILRDELSPDDELCLTIDDLGLETGETSTSNNDLTFAQIMDLHTALLRNDGETVMPPLYVTLGTRPEFGKTFAKLLANARQGKTLYEVIQSWAGDHALDVWADSEGHEEDTTSHIDGANGDGNEEVENVGGNGIEDPNERDAFEKSSQESTSPKPSTDDKLSANPDAQESHATEVTDVVDENGPSNEPVDPWTDSHNAETENTEINTNHEVDEDGDLIDYEDEDYVQMEKGVHTAPKQNNSNNHDQSAEYEAINENLNLSRRSSSRTIDGINEIAVSSSTDALGNVDGSVKVPDDLTSHANEDVGEEVELGEGYDNAGDDEREHQDNGDEDEAEAKYEEDDVSYDIGAIVDQFEEQIHSPSQREENGPNGQDLQNTPSDKQNVESLDNDDHDEIGYEEDDAEGPLFTLAHSPENTVNPAATDLTTDKPKEETDEIDYEDDDEETPVEDSEPTTPAKQVVTGKRPHEVDEDALDTSAQDAKRPRS